MNERIIFISAALLAEMSAATVFSLLLPNNPLCALTPDRANYVGWHTTAAISVWLLVLAAAWLVLGGQLFRTRQHHGTKLKFLGSLCSAGVVIDMVVSLYQFEGSQDSMPWKTSTGQILAGLGVQAALYVVSFAAVVAGSFLFRRERHDAMTPPPRFGRD